MNLQSSESKDRMSRREFLRIPRPKNVGIPIIDKEKCTGCGLCTIDCPTKALTISQNGERDTYQLLFLKEACHTCGICEKSCPENCLQLVEQGLEQDRMGRETKVIFEDKISKCTECGIPLFPQAMVKKLENKILMSRETTWPFNLCPSCRIKTQFEKEMIEKIKI